MYSRRSQHLILPEPAVLDVVITGYCGYDRSTDTEYDVWAYIISPLSEKHYTQLFSRHDLSLYPGEQLKIAGTRFVYTSGASNLVVDNVETNGGLVIEKGQTVHLLNPRKHTKRRDTFARSILADVNEHKDVQFSIPIIVRGRVIEHYGRGPSVRVTGRMRQEDGSYLLFAEFL